MAEKLMSGDLLVEILVRLPDARSAIQTSLVCKRWYSLIMNEYFKNRFVEIHPKVSEILISCRKTETTPQIFHRLSLTCPSLSEPRITRCNLPLSDVIIRATCGDLILVSKGLMQYFVCSSRIDQSVALPKIHPTVNFEPFMNPHLCPSNRGFAIVPFQEEGRFKVIIIFGTRCWDNKQYVFWMQSFDTQTKEWNFDIASCPFVPYSPECLYVKFRLHIVQNQKGVLYWLDHIHEQLLLIEFDPFSHECRVIGLPPNFNFNHINTYKRRGFNDMYRLGVVCDRVRLSQLLRAHDNSVYELCIWELDASSSSWELIHEVSLDAHARSMFLLAMNPDDGDVIFLIRNELIFRFKITEYEYHKLSSFPGNPFHLNLDELVVARYLTVLNVNDPAWPLPISSFES